MIDPPLDEHGPAGAAGPWALAPPLLGAGMANGHGFLGGEGRVPGAAAGEALAGGVDALADAQRMLFKDRTVDLCNLLSEFKILRFNELQRKMGGISTRTLAGRLAALQTMGFVRRRVVRAIPPHVEYRLTPEGSAFLGLVRPLYVYLRSMPSPRPVAAPSPRLDLRPAPRRPPAVGSTDSPWPGPEIPAVAALRRSVRRD